MATDPNGHHDNTTNVVGELCSQYVNAEQTWPDLRHHDDTTTVVGEQRVTTNPAQDRHCCRPPPPQLCQSR